MRNAVFWDVTPCGSCKNGRSPILFTLIMEALRSSETSVLTGATQRNILEEGILHSHHRKNLKSYNISDTEKISVAKVGCLKLGLHI
jgi:hypothetical protein